MTKCHSLRANRLVGRCGKEDTRAAGRSALATWARKAAASPATSRYTRYGANSTSPSAKATATNTAAATASTNVSCHSFPATIETRAAAAAATRSVGKCPVRDRSTSWPARLLTSRTHRTYPGGLDGAFANAVPRSSFTIRIPPTPGSCRVSTGEQQTGPSGPETLLDVCAMCAQVPDPRKPTP